MSKQLLKTVKLDKKARSDSTGALRRAKGIAHVAQLLSMAQTKSEVAKTIMEEGFAVLTAKSGDISLLHEDGSFEIVAQKGYPKNFSAKWSSIPQNEELLTSRVLRTKKAYFIKNTDELDEKYSTARTFIKASGSQSGALIPLKLRGKVVGVLQFTFKKPQDFNREDKMFMYTLADQCALAFDRVMALEALKTSRDQLEIILKNTADGIVVQDINGNIVYINDVGAHLAGYSGANKLQGVNLTALLKNFEISDENHVPIRIQGLISRPPQKSISQVLIHVVHKKSGEAYWLVAKSSSISGAGGQLQLQITTLQDVTQVKELERRKDDFISVASHELKTPLSSMKLFIEILLKRLQKVGETQERVYVEKLKQQADRLQMLVNDLLDVSRISNGKLQLSTERFLLNELIEDVTNEIRLVTSHLIEVKAEEQVYVFADKYRIYQVITNFLTNAVKYSPANKKIIVSVSKKNSKAVVSVKDFGKGIPKSDQQKVFERFYQVSGGKDGSGSGLGIGLYISKEIIDRHGGMISIKSNKGKGSTFSFNLPVA